MADKQALGMLTAAELRDLVSRGEVDAIWAVTPDLYGRPVGKRYGARFFIDEVLDREVALPARVLFGDFAGQSLALPSGARVDIHKDLSIRPDTGSLRRAAWLDRTVVAVCDVIDPATGELFQLSSRSVLKRQMERARSASVVPRGAMTTEFYLLDEDWPELREGEAFSIGAGGRAACLPDDHGVVGAMMRELAGSGVALEHVCASTGAGQYEVRLSEAGLLDVADRQMIAKWAIKDVAARHSVRASFMALPTELCSASRMEIETSLSSADRGAALFSAREPGDRSPDLPVACRWWIGGLLRQARSATLCFAPTVNSYKRYRVDDGSASAIGWSSSRSSVAFRVVGDEKRRQVSCKLAGADANPFVASAAILAAGLDGLSARADAPAEIAEGSALRALPRAPMGILEAAELAAQSTFLRQAIGEGFVELLAYCGRYEQARFDGVVTSWEQDRYLQDA